MHLLKILAQAASTPTPAPSGGGGSDLLPILVALVGVIGTLVGVLVGVTNLLDWREKRRERQQANLRASQPEMFISPVATVATVEQTTPTPPITVKTPPGNLPESKTLLIGREKELAAAKDLLLGDVHLLTLTGPGGTGKTRLSLAIGQALLKEFDDGVYFIALAPLSDPDLVVSTIAQTLGVKEAEGHSLLDNLKSYLRGKQMLLVLDNFEQLISFAPVVAELLSAAPQLKIIVTSRTVLRVTGEYEFPVPPLELPDPNRLPRLELLARYESVALFVERARAVKPYFALTQENAQAVTEICVRLDGLPLAIELAAARTKMLTPQAILERLSSRLMLLTGGARDLPARQQTLRNAIDWSHDLLEAGEQQLFRRLSVFVGGCTLEAAEAVCQMRNADFGLRNEGTTTPQSPIPSPQSPDILDGLSSLVDKSLVRQESVAGKERFRMLETIREYALERLVASGELEAVQNAHAVYFDDLAKRAESKFRGPEQAASLAQVEAEHDNMRAALDWAQSGKEGDGKVELGLRLAGRLGSFWKVRGYLTEGRERLSAILSLQGAENTLERAHALTAASLLALEQTDYASAISYDEAALSIWRELDNKPGMANAFSGLGHVASQQGDFDAARQYYSQSLELRRELGDKQGVAYALNNLGIIAKSQEDYASAHKLLEECVATLRELGDKQGVASALHNLGNIALNQDDYGQARVLYEESIAIKNELGDKGGIAMSLGNLGKVALRQQQFGKAKEFFEQSLALSKDLGNKVGISKCLAGLAEVACSEHVPDRAARLMAASQVLLSNTGTLLDPADQTAVDRCIADVRKQLGPDAFSDAWSAGQSMQPEQAIAFALG